MSRIPFTVVSDPEDSDEEAECLEIGMAELDLPEVMELQFLFTYIYSF